MIKLEEIRKIIKFIEEYRLKIRVKLKSRENPTNWCSSLSEPSPGYLDFSLEPVTPKEIDYIELNCIIVTKIGRLVPDNIVDKEQIVQEHLVNNKIKFSSLGNGVLRIEFG